MKKLIMLVFGDYDFDDRIIKKSNTLSKKFNVKVISFVYKKSKTGIYKIKKNLVVEKIYVPKKLKIFYRTFASKLFLKKIVKDNPADIYDCNDPDTMWGGYFAKKYYNSKIIYDSHELWSDFSRTYKNKVKQFYSWLLGSLCYSIEKKLFLYFDKHITVNEVIKHILEYKYKVSNIFVIYNFYSFIDYNLEFENNSVVFIGSKRKNVELYLSKIHNQFKIQPEIIGFKGEYSKINYHGFLNKNKYESVLSNSKYGVISYDVNCKNIFCATPNKVFQYIQFELPFIAIDVPGFESLKKYNLGVYYDFNSCKDFLSQFKGLIENYDYYLKNIRKYKKELSWEKQEKMLFKIY